MASRLTKMRCEGASRQRLGALDQRAAAGVGVGIDEEDLAGQVGEGGEEGFGFVVVSRWMVTGW
jgi:hypothetical protein